MGLIGGFCHLYIGQEAVVVGMQAAIEDGDQVITGYRDHGHMLACGMDPNGVMAELTGRRDGYSQRQGRLDAHVQRREAVLRRPRHRRRAGLARRRPGLRQSLSRKDGGVCLTYFGDGAANQGQVYESFNMASLWKLPVVYHHREQPIRDGHRRSSAHRPRPISTRRGISFLIPGEEVDGMDVLAVTRGRPARRRARALRPRARTCWK